MSQCPELQPDTVRILISRIRDGDQSAYSELASQVQSYLLIMSERNLNKLVQANVGPSDIVQQTMIRMVNGIKHFRGNSTPELMGWLNKIVKNESRKASRDLTRQKRDIRLERSIDQENQSHSCGLQDYEVTPQSAAVTKERIELFHLALSRLSEDYAMVIRLRSLEQLKFDEIGERMNRTATAANNLWVRALQKFEKELEILNEQSRQ